MSDSIDSPPSSRARAQERAAALQVPLVGFMNKWRLALMPLVPVPHRYLRWLFLRDDVTENSTDGWGRPRATSEVGRHAVIQGFFDHFTPGGALLDVGCSETFATRRLFRQLSVLGPLQAELRIGTGGASWLVRVYRPQQDAQLASETAR